MEEGSLERANPNDVLTIRELAQRLRCSKAHVSNLKNGKVDGVPTLPHISMGRRKLVRREWLDTWMEAYKTTQSVHGLLKGKPLFAIEKAL
jgi:excisionase family DNA binding protein